MLLQLPHQLLLDITLLLRRLLLTQLLLLPAGQ
jgi:hypothetical protein